jgi:phosphotransferase system HPr (HPr) family protein
VGTEESFLSITLTLSNQLGLHTRPATLIVQFLQEIKSTIHFTHKQRRINAKSVLNLLTLAAKSGEEIIIEAQGEDAAQALEGLTHLFNNRFDEE